MSNYKRAFVPGGTFFFTLVTLNRQQIFTHVFAVELLVGVTKEAMHKWPFDINAMVTLPDHLHILMSLPSGDSE